MAQTLTDVFDIRIQFPIDLRTVKADINARNAIETLQRYEGLAVWVVSEQKLYRLVGGITNDDWVDQTSANNGLQAVTVSTSAPTGGNPGDIHFRNVSGGTDIYYNNAGSWGIVGTIPTGGITPTLQQVTDEGNKTNNVIQVTGQGNVDLTQQSLVMSNQGATSQVSHASGGSVGGTLLMTANDARMGTGTGTGDNCLFVGAAFSAFQTNAGSLTVVRGADAVGDDDLVTKRQLNSVAPTYTLDPSLPDPPTLSYLNANYPTAKPGDTVYWEGTTQIVTATCYAAGKWKWITENKCQ